MRKIPTLFKREHDDDPGWRGPRPVTKIVRPGCEWVLEGEGVATEKFDGTSCLIRGGKLFRRQCRKPTKAIRKQYDAELMKVDNDPTRLTFHWHEDDYPPAPEGWEDCDRPAPRTGLWPGWVPVNADDKSDQWHVEAFGWLIDQAQRGDETSLVHNLKDGTLELVGPKVQQNLYKLTEHQLWRHGMTAITEYAPKGSPRTFASIKKLLEDFPVEGVVFHHPDSRMAKLKRKDLGLPWPVPKAPELTELERKLASVQA